MLSSFHKLIVTSAIAVLVVGILAAFAWLLMRKVDTIRAEMTETNAAIASMEDQRRRAGALARVVEERTFDFDRIGFYFIDGARPVAFIETLEDLARKTDTTAELTVGGGTISEGELTFTVKVLGRAVNVQKYLRLLELLPHEIRVENYDYEVRPSGSGAAEVVQNAILNVTLRVKTKE